MKVEASKLNRINVIGTSGSGKSTFSKELSSKLKLPYIEMDSLYWKDDWRFASDEELMENVRIATNGVRWLLDGNYNRTQPIKWKNVQTIIWLDYPFYLVFFRVLKRSITRLFDKRTLWGTNNRESFQQTFLSHESIILWMWTSYPHMKKRYTKLFEKNTKDWQLIRLTSPTDTKTFLINLENYNN